MWKHYISELTQNLNKSYITAVAFLEGFVCVTTAITGIIVISQGVSFSRIQILCFDICGEEYLSNL